jgi:hypothetical protein
MTGEVEPAIAFRTRRAEFDAVVAHLLDHPVFNEQGDEVRRLVVHDHDQAHSVYFCDPNGHRLNATTYELDR